MTPWAAMIVVGGTMVVGSLLYLLVARLSPTGGRSDRTPTNVYAVTAGAMSLLIAFTMSSAYDDYKSASQAIQQEADAVYSMNRAAAVMQPPIRDELRNQLVCYANDVIDLEWPLMRAGQTVMSLKTRQTLTKMDTLVAENPAATSEGLSEWQAANLLRLGAHQDRLLVAGDDVPLILWILLILGSAITIVSLFVYADRAKPGWGHILVIIGPLFIASAALVVIAFFDHPYSSAPDAVTPAAMRTMRTLLTDQKVGDLPMPRCPTAH